MKKMLLVIDDDDKLRQLLSEYFQRFGLLCRGASNAEAGLDSLKQHPPDLVILDVMLPGGDGFEACRQIRQLSSVPIIMLTARGDVSDRIVGLELGADDYLAKPFEPRELLARVQTVLRRSEGPLRTPILEFENLRIDADAQRVEVEGEAIELSALEFQALLLFARNPGKVLSRDTLFAALRGVETASWVSLDRSIDVLVSRLRHKLGDRPRAPTFLKTVRGQGYLFHAPKAEKKAS